MAFSFSDERQTDNNSDELIALRAEIESLKNGQTNGLDPSGEVIATFLTFQKGDAEQAMNFYTGLFENSKIIDVIRWGADGPGEEGTIMHATFNLNGQLYMCSDSPPVHAWDFTPAVSNFVAYEDEARIDHHFAEFSKNGKVLMPLGNYGFSKKFGWVVDQFGVSWQLNMD